LLLQIFLPISGDRGFAASISHGGRALIERVAYNVAWWVLYIGLRV